MATLDHLLFTLSFVSGLVHLHLPLASCSPPPSPATMPLLGLSWNRKSRPPHLALTNPSPASGASGFKLLLAGSTVTLWTTVWSICLLGMYTA
jgi:hypothetical protein